MMQKFKETFTAGDGSQLVRATFTVGPYVGGPSLAGVHNPRETWNNWAMPFLTFDGVVELAEWVQVQINNGYLEYCGGPSVDDSGRVFWNNTENVQAGGEIFCTYFDEYGDEPFFDVRNFGWAFELSGGE
jgi:hypothetical protein